MDSKGHLNGSSSLNQSYLHSQEQKYKEWVSKVVADLINNKCRRIITIANGQDKSITCEEIKFFLNKCTK